jgi:hypothetical protein
MNEPTNQDDFERFSARLSAVEREIPATPPFHASRSVRVSAGRSVGRSRSSLAPALAAIAVVVLVAGVAVVGGSLRTSGPSATASGSVSGSAAASPASSSSPTALSASASGGVLTPGTSPSSSGRVFAPYHIESSGDHLISTPADCAFLSTEWLRTFCGLALRPSWSQIVADTDPQTTSASWFAALARAQMDGDLTICEDVRMRTWVTAAAHLGGAPGPSATQPPLRPIAGCQAIFEHPVSPGRQSIDDPTAPALHPASVVLTYPTPVVTPATPPQLDPAILCDFGGPALTCQRVVDAVLARPDAPSITGIRFAASNGACPSGAACPVPSTLGVAAIGYGSQTRWFNVRDTHQGLAFDEVAGPDGSTPSPTASASG